VADASSAIQRIQKALIERNIQLTSVLTDISGVSVMTIIGAVLEGERDPWQLAALAQPGVKAIPAVIAKSLEGNWREELLFVLRQEVELYRVYQEKFAACDQQLRQHLDKLGSKVDLEAQPNRSPAQGQEGKQACARVRSADGSVSDYRYRLGANQRHGCADCATVRRQSREQSERRLWRGLPASRR